MQRNESPLVTSWWECRSGVDQLDPSGGSGLGGRRMDYVYMAVAFGRHTLDAAKAISPVSPVPDAATLRQMLKPHKQLGQGMVGAGTWPRVLRRYAGSVRWDWHPSHELKPCFLIMRKPCASISPSGTKPLPICFGRSSGSLLPTSSWCTSPSSGSSARAHRKSRHWLTRDRRGLSPTSDLEGCFETGPGRFFPGRFRGGGASPYYDQDLEA